MSPGWPEKVDHDGLADFFNSISQKRISEIHERSSLSAAIYHRRATGSPCPNQTAKVPLSSTPTPRQRPLSHALFPLIPTRLREANLSD